ncbi:908_t:CDS:2 [Funneliformis caledonium]|uniref:908_t:CDS:1 n=1 Tax=Funneliformis caledonium TaxID=1117310 RepID=A0A9N9FEY5_9GLOM|nr:908_t:CDS:2 [Funneliformis caledonium]
MNKGLNRPLKNRKIIEAWNNADDEVRLEYENLYLQHKMFQLSTFKIIWSPFPYWFINCVIVTIDFNQEMELTPECVWNFGLTLHRFTIVVKKQTSNPKLI